MHSCVPLTARLDLWEVFDICMERTAVCVDQKCDPNISNIDFSQFENWSTNPETHDVSVVSYKLWVIQKPASH